MFVKIGFLLKRQWSVDCLNRDLDRDLDRDLGGFGRLRGIWGVGGWGGAWLQRVDKVMLGLQLVRAV